MASDVRARKVATPSRTRSSRDSEWPKSGKSSTSVTVGSGVESDFDELSKVLDEVRRGARAQNTDYSDARMGDIITRIGVWTLSSRQRLVVAQNLIGSVAEEGEEDSRERVRSTGRESILERFALLSPLDVSRILAPTSKPTRSVAQKRRAVGELIGLPVGARPDYHYPDFQLDAATHQIKPLVKYANKRLDAKADPYGAASWWLTASDLLDGHSPLEELENGQLTEIAVDNLLDAARRGM